MAHYLVTFVDEHGAPDISQAIYLTPDVHDGELEETMVKLTTVTEAVKILQPQKSTAIFRLDTIE